MASRPRIGIPFNYDENWIGGTYYIANLISSLKLLPERDQPTIYLLSHSRRSFDFIRQATNYHHLRWLPPMRLQSIDGGISRRARVLARLLPSFLKRPADFDVIFPFPIDWKSPQTVCWIPDFQEKHLPELFDAKELASREKQHRDYIQHFRHIVFSSHAAQDDFRRFYPEAPTRTHVVHFAVFQPLDKLPALASVLVRHGLPKRYFYCPNQFWIHKNHVTVIDAVTELRDAGIDVTMVFSGKEHDHRAPDHARLLKQLVHSRSLDDHVRFLGFLPRDEQLALFKGATAIIQPSLFEGWSTVIEDAKSFSKYVIAADLAVNREQISTNAEFFPPKDSSALAKILARHARQEPACQPMDYSRQQSAFARDFMAVVEEVIAERNSGDLQHGEGAHT